MALRKYSDPDLWLHKDQISSILKLKASEHTSKKLNKTQFFSFGLISPICVEELHEINEDMWGNLCNLLLLRHAHGTCNSAPSWGKPPRIKLVRLLIDQILPLYLSLHEL